MKIYQPIANICLATLLSALLSGCSTAEMQKMTDDLARINGSLSTTAINSSSTLAIMPTAKTDKNLVAQLVLPADPRIRAAIDASLPNVKNIIGIHQCIREFAALRQLNFLAVPGVDIMKNSGNMGIPSYGFPNSDSFMKFHDRSKCVSVKSIDSWGMPALNALKFRVVYFAEDSGETVNFQYLLKKVDDGSWKLASFVQM